MIKSIKEAKTGYAFITVGCCQVTNHELVLTRNSVFNDIKQDARLQQLYDMQVKIIRGNGVGILLQRCIKVYVICSCLRHGLVLSDIRSQRRNV